MAFTGEIKSTLGSGALRDNGRVRETPFDGDACCTKATAFNRLANAIERLDGVTGYSIGLASRLTGGWPTNAKSQTAKEPASGGHFGEIDAAADAINRICDRLNEANDAITARLP